MKTKYWIIFCSGLVLFLTVISAEKAENVENATDSVLDDVVYDDDDPIKWSVDKALKKTKENINYIIKLALPTLMGATEDISSNCTRSLIRFVSGVKKMDDWAAKMLDATSKLPSGILVGTTTGFGSYDECVDVIATEDKSPSKELFRGQYCTVNVWPPKSLVRPIGIVANASGMKNFENSFMKVFPERSGFGDRFRLAVAICMPSTCSKNDVTKLAATLVKPFGFGVSLHDCSVKETPELNKNQLAIICILAPLAFLIILGTLVDALSSLFSKPKNETKPKNTKKGSVSDFFRVFSLYSNTLKFLDVPKSGGKFGVLAGLRFLSITWIILGHSYYFPHLLHFAKFKDMFTVTETQYDFAFMVIQNTALAVDTFFFISGFLTTYSSWKRMSNTKGKISPVTFFIKRIMRMLPAQFLIMGILLILPLFGSGPLWKGTWDEPVRNCEKYWWTNLIFIQNYWGLENMCLFHTWFIAISMQLHVITFFLLLLLYRRPAFGILMNILLILGGTVAVALMTYYRELAPTFDVDTRSFPQFHEFYDVVYIQIYSHLGPYCVGVLVGYYVSLHPDRKLRNPACRFICWLVASAIGLATVYGLYAFTGNVWAMQSPVAHVSYAATFRTGWGLSVAWVVYDSVTQQNGIVNSILSWKPLSVLDKLTFLAYLLHPLVMYYHQARMREVMNTDYIDMIYYFLGTTILTYMMSFLFHIAVEQPVNSLDSILFGSPRNRQSDDKTRTLDTPNELHRPA